jgi:hypothetical protein
MEATKKNIDNSKCYEICEALTDFALADDDYRCLVINSGNGHVLICFIDKPIHVSITFNGSINTWRFCFTQDGEISYTEVLDAELEGFKEDDAAYMFWWTIKFVYGLYKE